VSVGSSQACEKKFEGVWSGGREELESNVTTQLRWGAENH